MASASQAERLNVKNSAKKNIPLIKYIIKSPLRQLADPFLRRGGILFSLLRRGELVINNKIPAAKYPPKILGCGKEP